MGAQATATFAESVREISEMASDLARAAATMAVALAVVTLRGCAVPHARDSGVPIPASASVGSEASATSGNLDDRADAPALRESACQDTLDDGLARLNCEGDRILLAHPLELRPDHVQPTGNTRRVLDAVAALLDERSDILLVRIEAYSSEPPSPDRSARRHQILESQRHADAVFHYLWKKRGISAERMEPVGYGWKPRLDERRTRWPVVIRVVQWARQ